MVKASDRPVLKCTEEIYEIFREHWNMDLIGLIEEFKVIYLNRSNAVLGILNVSTGGLTGVVADPRVIFAAACKEFGKVPDKTYKGTFNIRVSAELHKQAALFAAIHDITLNDFVKKALAFTLKHKDELIQSLHANLLENTAN